MYLNKIIILMISICLFGCTATESIIKKEASLPIKEIVPSESVVNVSTPIDRNDKAVKTIETNDMPVKIVSLKRTYKSNKINPVLHIETIITRSIILPITNLPESSYSFIYLNSKPTTKLKYDKYINICETWLSVFNTKEEIKDYIRSDENIEFHNLNWLLKKPIDDINNCKEYIDNYDYGRANIIARSLKVDTNKIQIITKLKNETLAININKATIEELEKVMYVWKDIICKPIVDVETIKPNTIFDSFKMALSALGSMIQFKISVN